MIQLNFKICNQCGKRKLMSEGFYAHARMSDGHLNKCKDCVKKRIKRWRRRNIKEVRNRENRRSQRPERVAARKIYQQTEAGRASLAKTRKRWLINNKEKRAVHIIVSNAIRNGKLKRKPCQKCGAIKSQAHHNDYTKPLKVKWFCSKHHREADIKRREAI